MVMATEVTTKATTFWEAIYSQRNEFTTLGWAQRLREAAFDRFKDLGFPSVKEEEWKYTNVAPLSKLGFQTASQVTDREIKAAEVERLGFIEAKDSTLVFVNGVLRKDLSSLKDVPAGVIAMGLDEAFENQSHQELIREHLGRGVDYNTNGFVALNTAMLANGAFILIPKNVETDKPLSLLFISAGNVASFPRVLVIAEAHSKATLVESYANAGASVSFTNAVVEVFLQDGARLEHYKVQRESVESFHIASTNTRLGANSTYDSTAINFGAQLSRHDIAVQMDHEGAECWIDGLYLVSSGQHTDTHSVIDHQKPHCTSHQLYKGILDGKSRAVFNGKIFVRHGAQKTDAMQTNKNLLLSKEARIDTKPQLEILADDVKCAHGAAVGQIDEDELFYLQTRGLHGELARNLLTYGFAEEVIGKIKIDSIRAQLDEAVLTRLNARLEA